MAIRLLSVLLLARALLSGPGGCAARPPQLGIEFSPEAGDRLRVGVEFDGEADGDSVVAVERSWGGTPSESRWFDGVAARGEGGRRLPVRSESPTAWRIEHAPGERVRVDYALAGLPAGYADVDDYRPIHPPEGVAVFTPLAVLLPAHLGPDGLGGADGLGPVGGAGGSPGVGVDVEVRWSGLPEGWHAAGSFGRGPGPHRGRYAWTRILESFVCAGRFEAARRDVPGGEFAAVRIGEGGAFTAAEMAELTRPIIAGVRTFFDARDRGREPSGGGDDPWYLVSFAPAGEPIPGGFALGGTAVTNAFAFYFDPGVDLAAEPGLYRVVAHVLCHEYFHNWNGVLFFIAEPAYEHESRWIVEGFTDFFARRILLRAGVLDAAGYAASLNERVAAYATNPHRGLGNRAAAGAWDEDESISGMIYERGDLLAVLIDQRMREATGGRESLDDLMLDLAARARAGEPEADPEWVLAWIGARTGPGLVDLVRTIVRVGGDVPLPPTLDEPGLVLEGQAGGTRFYRAD